MLDRDQIKSGYMRAAGQKENLPYAIATEAQLTESLQHFLEQRPNKDPVWVFGYGSLMWNPAFNFIEKSSARLEGYQRRFCLLSMIGRGTPQAPGLMLALDQDGCCDGVAFRVAEQALEDELAVLWLREMLSSSYIPTWLRLKIGDTTVQGMTFIINRNNERYLGEIAVEEAAQRLNQAKGYLGSGREYLFNTHQQLETLEIDDPYITELMACSNKL